MGVDPSNVDFRSVEDVTDIEPEPTFAAGDGQRHIGSIGSEGKAILSELIDATPDDEPWEDRIFGRLGVSVTHTTWRDVHVYWAEDEREFVDALNEWKRTREMAGPAHRRG